MRQRIGQNMNKEEQINWKTRQPINIDELIQKYRPKQIKQYEENGQLIRVFERSGNE